MKKTILLSLLASTLLVAQTIELEPLVINSTLIKTDELRSTDAVEIYTSDDIQKAHAQNIYEFLNEQTSVVSMPSYGNPFTQLIDFRGYGTSNGNENIVITINGRKINNIDSIPQLLAGISLESIERIEIIKSSGIVMAGDGANAGVINIITKKNSNEKGVAFYAGTYGVVDGSFNFNHSDDKLSLSASGEAQKSSGIRTIDADGNKDESKLSMGTFNLAYAPNEKLEIRLGASFARTDIFYASSLTLNQYRNNTQQAGSGTSNHQLFDTDSINAGISYFIDEKLSLHVDASDEKKKSNYISPYYSSLSDYDYKSAKAYLSYLSDIMSLNFGYDGFYGERTQSDNSFKKQSNAAFVMSEFYSNNSTFKAGYRFESIHYDFADQGLSSTKNLSGIELGYNYIINKENSIFTNFTQSYKAPNIDSFFGFDPITYASIYTGTIQPMHINSYALGYSNIQKKNKFKASVFYVSLKDEIYLDPISYVNTNIDKSHKYGFDVSNKFIANDKFNIVLNYNFVQALIDSGDYANKKLPGVSNHNIKATLNYLPIKCITVALTQIYRSEAYAIDDFNNNFSQKQDAYKSTDISATYKKDNYEFFAKINNLFNQKNGLWVHDDAIYPLNYTTTAIAGLKIKF